MSVRVRYAPSPTGLQHIGSVRTALFNYLFAKSQQGTFILRLEDTDRTRFSETYVQNLYDTFQWLGFYWDEGPDIGGPVGPYIQSERISMYQQYAHELVRKGSAYYCFCKDKRAQGDEAEDSDNEGGFGYPRTCRNLDPTEAQRRVSAGEPYVIRLKIPLEGSTVFEDLLLGTIEWKNVDINPDPVLLKSDGFPTYHLANVIDDHFMNITHIMRAQEWISSTPLHIIMYRAFGWDIPKLCHLPMVLGQDGHKLSKRHGATAVNEFRKKGYLSEALVNYVALLGCSYKDGQDLYTLEELAENFSIKHLNKAPAVFDYVKLEWFNGQYIRMKSDEELAKLLLPFMSEAELLTMDAQGMNFMLKAVPLIKERLKYLSDAPLMLSFVFKDFDVPPAEELIPKKLDAAATVTVLLAAKTLLETHGVHDHAVIEQAFRAKAEELGHKLGDLLMPLRMAVTGTKVSPPLFESIALVGIEKACARIDAAIQVLQK